MPKKKPDREVKAETTETLECVLTPAEWQQRAEEMALTLAKMDEAELEIAAAKSAHKSKMDDYKSRLAALGVQVRTRKESRLVTCEVVADWKQGTIETVRLDTGEVVRSRDMTPKERQVDLNIVALGE